MHTTNRFGHHALGILAMIGPLAMAVWALAIPYLPADEPQQWIPALAANPGRAQLAFWMLLVFALTAPLGAIIAGLVARRSSPKLATTAMVLAFTGFTALSFSGAGYDGATLAAAKSGLDTAAVEKLLTQMDQLQAPTIGAGALTPLMAIGVILLGIALWRGKTVPKWAAACLIAAFPVIFAGGAIAMWLNALGWLLLAAGFGAAGQAFAQGNGEPAHAASSARALAK